MGSLIKLEQDLLSKQLLEAELDNFVSEFESHEMQLSVHIISGKDLPVSIHSKVHRQLKFCLDTQMYETKLYTCEGINPAAKWNETHLVPVGSLETSLKIVYIDTEVSNKPLGGAIIKLSGLIDQQRYDGWYDIGCGEIRLAIRLLHNSKLFYQSLLMTLSQSIHQTEYLVTKSINIAKESRLNQLYDGLVGKLLKDLVLNGNLVRKVWNCAALCIQRGYKAWKKKLREQTQKILIIACSEREAEVRKLFYERLDSLIETIEVQNREKERNLAQSNSLQKLYSEGRRALDIPPYIEVAEKVFRKRIAIKRYS